MNKLCSSCHITKDISEFHKCKNKKFGVGDQCKLCKKAHFERIKAKQDAIIYAQKECTKCGVVKQPNEFKKDILHITGLRSCCRSCEALYFKTAVIRSRKAKLACKYRANWTPEQHLAKHIYDRMRYAKKKGLAVRKFTLTEWKSRKEEYGYCCAYCMKHESICGKLTQDHFMPIKRNGEHSIENIIPACKSCNSSKNSKHPFDFVLNLNIFKKAA